MAPRKLTARQQALAKKLPKASTSAGIAQRQYKPVRFLENGLLDVKRKTGKYFKIARQNQQQSPLLRLPPELRNKIYGYVLGGKVFQFRSEKYHELVKSSMKKKQNLALLGVCRQVYAETALLPFTLSTFSIRYVKTWHKWLADIKTARAANIKFVQCQMTQVGSVVWTPYERWSSRTLVDLVSPHLKLRELPLLKHIEITIELFSFTSFARGDAETKAHAVESAKSLNRAIQVQRPDVTIEIWIKEEEFQELYTFA